MSPLKVKYFLSSLQGTFKPGSSLKDSTDVASSMYLVTGTFSQDAPQLHCNCKAFFHFSECSHIVAAMTLENLFNLQDKISSIARGKMRGRPKNYNPVGFAAHSLNPTQQDLTIQMARNTVGGTVARIKDRGTYAGTITGYDRIPSTNDFTFSIHYPRQFEDDVESADETLTYQELVHAKQVYVQHRRSVEGTDNLFCGKCYQKGHLMHDCKL
jgi:hypothetical protein